MMNFFAGKTILAAFGAAALLMAVPAGAQTQLRVDVPFGFVAGDQMYAAGPYRVEVDQAQHFARITSQADGKVSFVRLQPVMTRRAADDTDHAALRFEKHGNRFILEGLWGSGKVEGNAVAQSRRMRESAKTAPIRAVLSGTN
jgi:hypothetical protein